MFSAYDHTDHVKATMEDCQKVNPTKIWSTKRDTIDDDISKEQLFSVLHKMDRKSSGLNGFPFEFSKMMWDPP